VTLVRALLNADDLARLRDALTAADYTSTGIATLIGPGAVDAVRRNDFRALLRAATRTGGADDHLATLVRLFIGGQTEPAGAVAGALHPLPLEAALQAGLVEPYGDGIHAGVDLDVYGDGANQDWWVISDLDVDARPGPLRADYVLGIGNAATTLAGATIRRPVGTALDVGTGCGVQALHLSRHAGAITATDLSERALRFAATTAALNGMQWELLAGDLLAPVAGRRFDLVVSNPPFVVGPSSTRYTYRDSGRAGDAVCADLAAAAPDVLADGGTMQFLANWLHVRGADWRERVAGWVPEKSGCEAWIVQREVSDPVEYVNLWLRDASEAYDPQRAAAWLDWFDAQDVEAVGFGLVTIRRTGAADPLVRVEDLRQQVDAPMGAAVAAWFDRQEWLRQRTPVELLAARYRRADGLRLTQEASFVDDDWAVERQLVAQTDGLRWTEEVDPVVLALLSGADGRVALSEQLAVLAAAYDTGEAALAAMAVPVVGHLVERGLLIPSG
jgi:methylase of polypeptide subunit release factors